MSQELDLELFEVWDIQRIPIPARSHLYQLDPVGIGTPKVESLTSFISRLAESHCLFTGTLMERELAPIVNKAHGGANLHKIYSAVSALNGTGRMAFELVQALHRLTLRKDLQFLTLLVWSNLIPSRHLLRSKRAWCAGCYAEWKIKNQVIYEPLIWFLEVVEICPYHQERLTSRCLHCSKSNLPLAWQSKPGYCSKCHEWLGSFTKAASLENISEEQLRWELWAANAIGELVAHNPSITSLPTSSDVARVLCAFVDQMTEGNIAEFARQLQIPKNTLWLWCKGRNLPTLQALLKICYCTGISLLDFFMKGENLIKTYRIVNIPAVTKKSQPRAKSKPFDVSGTKSYLEAVIKSNEQPYPSLDEVARHLGCHTRLLSRHLPDLCHAISARYLSQRKENKQKAITNCCDEVQRVARELYEQGIYPSEAQVSKLITQPGYLRYKVVRDALRKTRQELNLEPGS
jgi:transcriptional regulator with XRE-family HTH domain